MHGCAPLYLGPFAYVADLSPKSPILWYRPPRLTVPPLAAERFQLLAVSFGTLPLKVASAPSSAGD